MRTGKVVLVMVAVALAGSAAPANAQISIGGPTAQAWVNAGALEGIAVTLTAIPANESPILYLGSGPNSVFDAPDRDGLNRGTLGLGVDNTLIQNGQPGVSSKPSEIGYYQNPAICGDGKALGQNCGDELRVALGQEVYGGSVTVSLFYGGEQAGETLIVQLYREEALVYEATEGPANNGEFNNPANNPGFYTFDLGAVCWDEIRFLGDERIVADAADYLVEGISNLTLCANTCETELIADGGSEETATPVGSVVTTDNGDGTWDVDYQTTGTWAITEVHLDVACSENDFPQTKKGNPKVGLFCFQDMIPEGTQSYTVAGIGPEFCHDDYCSCAYYFAAHAVVVDTASCDDAGAVMYGTEIGSGNLYQIDLDTGTAEFISVTGPFSPDDQNQPNGAAFDPANGRLYYSAQGVEGQIPSDLFFYDFNTGTEVSAGDLNGFDVGASFYGGAYYYIPNGTDDVNLVTLNADGTIAAVGTFLTDFTGDANKIYRFGDIAISADGMLYASTNGGSGSSAEFFSIDLATGVYTEICDDTVTGCMHSLQLAFGSDGTLYAHSASSGMFYSVDLATGVGTVMGTVTGSRLFSDLASGELCTLRTETAWGDGTDFPGNSWATWFECDNCD